MIQKQTHPVDNDHCGKHNIVAIAKQVDGTDSPYPSLCHPYATRIFWGNLRATGESEVSREVIMSS
jgi:hypothetical protein